MHHKHRKQTTRRIDHRFSSKEYRQQEKRAINEGRVRNHPWDQRQKSLPLIDQPSNGKARGGKRPTKKNKCSVNRTHEWYKEQIIETGEAAYGGPGYGKCEKCVKAKRTEFGWTPPNYCPEHKISVPWAKIYQKSICIHCWTEKIGKINYKRGRSPWQRNLRLKHRPQNLYT